MSELNNNIETISAVLDILQNNALPSQKPVLRLLGVSTHARPVRGARRSSSSAHMLVERFQSTRAP